MKTEILDNSDNLSWYLIDVYTGNTLDDVISCPGCNKTQGLYKNVYDQKESVMLPSGIGKSCCLFCDVEYKIFEPNIKNRHSREV